ncbi:MAG: methionine--tRNA ligase subunit beta, partial [Clostridiales bacterium]|nr:methionine--tRNA ligase subunit beta [Clostridiales bacterium]
NDFESELKTVALDVVKSVEEKLDKMLFSDALPEIWTLIRRANKFIDETRPWILAKDDAKKPELAGVLYDLAECLRFCSILISPVMTNAPAEIRRQLCIEEENLMTWDSLHSFGAMPKEVKVQKGNILFPRIEKEAEEEKMPQKPEITIDDFGKLDLRTGTVISCVAVEKSDKLLCSQIKIGNEVRQIVSGIRKYFSPEEIVGKKVVVVYNLKPVKLRGVLSQGMILCAEESDGTLRIITPENGQESGALVR